MKGWQGKVLHINLSEKTFEIEEPDQDIYLKFLGGKGLSGYYLSRYIIQREESEIEDIPIAIFSGPLTGTKSPACSTVCIASISKLTGTMGYNVAGGNFGYQLKRCGFDGLVITGKSSEVTGIEIRNEEVSFIFCDHLKEFTSSKFIEKLSFDGSVVAAGPGAFNGVLFSNLIIDGNIPSGRNGLGYSFGEKNLKYIAAKGDKKILSLDSGGVEKAMEDILRLLSASPVLKGDSGIGNYGTGALFDLISARRMIPTGNFKETYFENPSSINSYSFKNKFGYKSTGCRECIVKCGKTTEDGRIVPGYETMAHFTALLENRDMETVFLANEICSEYGMDTLSSAATLSCYSEINGIKLSKEEILSMLTDIGNGKNSELRSGSYRYALEKGREELSMSVKKQELPAYDPRGAYGMALSYATSTTGGCHLSAYPISHEILRKPVATDRFSFSGKARIVKIAEDMNAAADSLFICRFHLFSASLEEYSKIYNYVTGDNKSAQDLVDCGERINYNDRIINAALGFTKKDDDLPLRFFEEEGSSGNNIKISPIKREDFINSIDRYYRVRGLDENGLPVKEKAEKLGLKWKNF